MLQMMAKNVAELIIAAGEQHFWGEKPSYTVFI
jgi:hypothetical protein